MCIKKELDLWLCSDMLQLRTYKWTYIVDFVVSQYEEVRAELGAVQRELVGVREHAQGEARARDRLVQDLQAKVAQVCTLEGQLDSTRTLVQNLTQEVKRWVEQCNRTA